MDQNTVIDKHSKLFQRFMQTKAQQAQSTLPPTEERPLGQLNSHLDKENDSIIINRLARSSSHLQVQAGQTVTENKQKETGGSEREKTKKQEPRNNHRLVNNSLNIDSGMGLNKILKRAIQKVRQSKAQELIQPKRSSETSHDDSLEALQTPQNQKSASPKIVGEKMGSLAAVQLKNSVCRMPTTMVSQQTQTNEFKLPSLQMMRELETVKQQLEIERQRSSKLAAENKKLMKEINSQIQQNQALQKQLEDTLLRIKELESMTIQKDALIKRHNDDSNHWRRKFELQESTITEVTKAREGIQDRLDEAEKQAIRLREDLQAKQELLEKTKGENKKIIEESDLAKKYLLQLTVKLYQSEQRNLGLNSSILEPNLDNSQHHELVTNDKENPYPVRKREFSRQRAAVRVDSSKQKCPVVHKEEPVNAESRPSLNIETDTGRQLRIASIQEQLRELSQLKCVNGRIRRRKIELQRQLQNLSH